MTLPNAFIKSIPPRVGHTAVAANDFMIVWGGYRVRNSGTAIG